MRSVLSERLSPLWLSLIAVLAAAPAAHAETVVVKPSTMRAVGWKAATQKGVSDDCGYAFARSVGSAPAGTGSLHLWVGSGESDPLPKVYIGTNDFSGVRLDKITQFKLWVCPRWWDYSGAQPVTVELAVAKADNLRLFTFYPWGLDAAGYYGKMKWRECDLMGPGGAWAITNVDVSDGQGDWRISRCGR